MRGLLANYVFDDVFQGCFAPVCVTIQGDDDAPIRTVILRDHVQDGIRHDPGLLDRKFEADHATDVLFLLVADAYVRADCQFLDGRINHSELKLCVFVVFFLLNPQLKL